VRTDLQRGDNGNLRVVLDWGTSSFRAFLVDASGAILDRVETADGIRTVADRGFAGIVARVLAPWREDHGSLSILAAGMIGSRNGWFEAPYVVTPAGASDLAAAVRTEQLQAGGTITFFPGLIDRGARPFPDVMRGEETQLVGLGLDQDATVVLPGTHSKWARIEGGRITRFRSFATGEVFATMTDHSFLAHVAKRPAKPDWRAFARGLDVVRLAEDGGAGLLSRIFTVRTGWLAGAIDPSEMVDYLSGIVVGCEFAEAAQQGWHDGGAVTIVGGDDVAQVYRTAAEKFGLSVSLGPENAALIGCLRIAAELPKD
jgi:2-dehydro-3-deoxygalactonokinase